MNIENMTDEQKSVMLAKLVGWEVSERHGVESVHYIDAVFVSTDKFTARLTGPDFLYADKWMALAWRVLNWAADRLPGETGQRQSFFKMLNGSGSALWWLSPEQAQRLWLDKILSLAIEAGMVGKTS